MPDDAAPEKLLSDRQVLPRWRLPADAAREMEGTAHVRRTPVTTRDSWLERLRARHERGPSSQTAKELIETSFMLGQPLSSEEMSSLERVANPSRVAVNMSATDPIRQSSLDTREAINALRMRLKFSPHQPLAWTELARQYLANGNQEGATKAIDCALALAPSSRYVVRSAVRFYSRCDAGLDKALHLLHKTARVQRDPWLLAAEIAASDQAGRSSPYIATARKMLESGASAPRHYSELAAAVGTLEHDSGRHKKAKQLFAQSLLDPTDNSLAQAVFVSNEDKKIVVPSELDLRHQAFEARTRSAYANGNFVAAMEGADKWLRDEPFDIKPALLGSYMSFEPSLAAAAEEIATRGLRSMPSHASLLNNRAVARAYIGRLSEAFDDIKQSVKASREEPAYLATLGLIAYRTGFYDFGRECYVAAISWFSSRRDLVSTYRASLYWVREAIRAGEAFSTADLQFFRERIAKLPLHHQEVDLLALVNVAERELALGQAEPLLEVGQDEFPPEFEQVRVCIPIPEKVQARAKSILDEGVRQIAEDQLESAD